MAGPCWRLLQIRTLGKRAESQDFGRKLNSAGPEACVGGERSGAAGGGLVCFGVLWAILLGQASCPAFQHAFQHACFSARSHSVQHVVKKPQTKYEWREHKQPVNVTSFCVRICA